MIDEKMERWYSMNEVRKYLGVRWSSCKNLYFGYFYFDKTDRQYVKGKSIDSVRMYIADFVGLWFALTVFQIRKNTQHKKK